MKKVLLSTVVIIAFVVYGIIHSNKETTAVPVNATSSNSSNSNNTSNNSESTSSSAYKNGTYTGSAADAFYGNIQVQATISGGKITNITFLQAPSDRDDSVRINQQADPELAQEAIQAQSANVDIVSGATDTSNAFIQSLTSALNQAKS